MTRPDLKGLEEQARDFSRRDVAACGVEVTRFAPSTVLALIAYCRELEQRPLAPVTVDREVVERVRTLVDERLEVAKVEARETWGPPEELDAVLDRAGVIVKYRDVLALLSAQGSGGAE